MSDYKAIFGTLGELFCDKVEEFLDKCPLPGISVEKANEVMFSVFHLVGLKGVRDMKTQTDMNAYVRFLCMIYEATFGEELNDSSLQKTHGVYNDYCSGKIRIKKDFFDDFTHPSTDPTVRMLMKPFEAIYTEDVRFFANIFGNALFYPDMRTENQNRINQSPYEKYGEKFRDFVRKDLALMTIYQLFAKVEELF